MDLRKQLKFKLNFEPILPILDTQHINQARKGARVVESTGLENRNGRKAIVGSNPTPSADHRSHKESFLVASALMPLPLRILFVASSPTISSRGNSPKILSPSTTSSFAGIRSFR